MTPRPKPRPPRAAKRRSFFNVLADPIGVDLESAALMFARGRGWRPNPFLKITEMRSGEQRLGVVLTAPVPGKGVEMITLSQREHPELCDALLGGLFLDAATTPPRPVFYKCLLDDPPRTLVPRHIRVRTPPTRSLIVNPTLRYQSRGNALDSTCFTDLHVEARTPLWRDGRILEGFPLLWLEDPATRVLHAYWLRGRYADIADTLVPGQPAPAILDAEIVRTLVQADVLVSPSETAARREAWEAARERSREQLARDGYTVLRDVIPPYQLAALRQYYRDLVTEGHVPQNDAQVEGRYFLQNEPMAAHFHAELNGLMSHVFGQPTKPLLSYFGRYEAGASLKKHADVGGTGPFGVSLLLDHVPEVDRSKTWPLRMHVGPRRSRVVSTDLAIGDAVAYMAYEVPHSRAPLREGTTSHLFLFYTQATSPEARP